MIFFFHLAFFSIIKLAVSDFANNLNSFEYSLLIHGNEMMMQYTLISVLVGGWCIPYPS